MDMIYTWCTNHGVKWFYNPNTDDWEFTKNGFTVFLSDFGIKRYTRRALAHLEYCFS